ncbi:hypothetical protein EHP00_2425 [Ecytonucleospora hepatopenaei]|uniref:Uncharacterized protein n=1 Tax=Ecytonucleospora hepatopenaei TaxID=646526 RepID=A0A1W0E8Y7_9MICR|nr:hypothetical protein EHP00_2425 [Ecytonucleospora hepatopenaei]
MLCSADPIECVKEEYYRKEGVKAGSIIRENADGQNKVSFSMWNTLDVKNNKLSEIIADLLRITEMKYQW